MRALTRGRREPGVERQPPAGSSAGSSAGSAVRLQSQWTGGSHLATRAITVVLWSALVSGPLALALAALLLLSLAGPAPTNAAPAVDRAGERVAVQEFAQRFVVAWLQTPQGQEKQLASYVKVPSLRLAEVPVTAQGPATADVRQVGPGLWTVTVGVNVTPAAAGTSPAIPARRYFQVPVRFAAGALVAAALPAPVAAPAVAEAPGLAYRQRASLAHPLATSVGEFLAALLTGAGEVTRYASPGTTVVAVTPAPYTAVVVTDVMVDRDLPADRVAPAPGDQRRVLVTARASSGVRQEISVQYALTLLARAGRWEVKAVDPAPMTVPSAASPTN